MTVFSYMGKDRHRARLGVTIRAADYSVTRELILREAAGSCMEQGGMRRGYVEA